MGLNVEVVQQKIRLASGGQGGMACGNCFPRTNLDPSIQDAVERASSPMAITHWLHVSNRPSRHDRQDSCFTSFN